MVFNPSVNGWFKKFVFRQLVTENKYENESELYQYLRTSGFIYGKIVSDDYQVKDFVLTNQEKYKLFYVKALYHLDKLFSADDLFVHRLIVFYKNTVSEQWLKTENFEIKPNSLTKIESIIHERIKFYQGFSTNKYLQHIFIFIDILLFYRYLKGEKVNIHTVHFLEKFSESIITQKDFKSKPFKIQDYLKPFYTFLIDQNRQNVIEKIDINITPLGQMFFTDLAVINYYIIHKNFDDTSDLRVISQNLNISEHDLSLSIYNFSNFVFQHAEDYKIFEKKIFHKALFANTQSQLFLLLNRNKKRLIKEIDNNKKLLNLVTQSTFKNLSSEERKYVKEQLIEICKTIPSLAVFALPGGGILLPILLKFLPQLLPNSFNENKGE